jgi:hypothetical protein
LSPMLRLIILPKWPVTTFGRWPSCLVKRGWKGDNRSRFSFECVVPNCVWSIVVCALNVNELPCKTEDFCA